MVRGCGRSAAPQRWLADVVMRHGHQVGDGVFRLGSTQAELAADAGCSSGTIQARIRTLEGQGLVLSRRPLTVRLPLEVAPTVTQPEPRASRHRQAAASILTPGEPDQPAPPDALAHLLAANASLAAELAAGFTFELLDAQQAVVGALTTLSRIRESVLAEPRRNVADPRLSEEELVSKDLKLPKNSSTDSLTPHPRNRGSANQGPRESRIREEPPTSGTEIDELVQPLAAVADRCGLIGVTDRAGLHDALSPYSPDRIRRAVSQVTRMTKNGKISSPFGWLIAAAVRGDPDLFTTTASPTRHAPDHNPPARQSDDGDDAAEEALAQADDSELARLDDHIRTDPHFAPILSRILAHPETLHAARLEALRALKAS